MTRKADGAPFRPTGEDGFAGSEFVSIYCARCACEPDTDPNDMDGATCPILEGVFKVPALDPEDFPPEATWRGGVGHCSAFIERRGLDLAPAETLNPRVVAAKRDAYSALPRDPKTGRPVI